MNGHHTRGRRAITGDDVSQGRERAARGAPADRTPLTSSRVLATSAGGRAAEDTAPSSAPYRRRKWRESEPPARNLTPYQARLDVEMDDTAVSKVRDPSASIRLGPEGEVIMMPHEPHDEPPAPTAPSSRPAQRASAHSPMVSTLLGGAFGVLIVLITVALVRWWGGGP